MYNEVERWLTIAGVVLLARRESPLGCWDCWGGDLYDCAEFGMTGVELLIGLLVIMFFFRLDLCESDCGFINFYVFLVGSSWGVLRLWTYCVNAVWQITDSPNGEKAVIHFVRSVNDGTNYY